MFLLAIFKAGVGNIFFRVADTRRMEQTRCLLNAEVLLGVIILTKSAVSD
jgi:hypothetical protein